MWRESACVFNLARVSTEATKLLEKNGEKILVLSL